MPYTLELMLCQGIMAVYLPYNKGLTRIHCRGGAGYNKKVKLRYFCSLALRSFDGGAVVRASFSALSLENIRLSFLLFPNPLAYCRAYFLYSRLGKHRNSLFI